MIIQTFKNITSLLFIGFVFSCSAIANANQLQTICGVIPNGSVGDVGINTVQNCSISGGETFAGVDVLYTGTASSSADYGTLKASSSITTQNLTSTAISGQSIAVLTPSGYSTWADKITVTSPTLANGSAVNLQAFISLHAVFSDSTGPGQATFGSQGGTSGAAINGLLITKASGISSYSQLGLVSREWEYAGQGTQSFQGGQFTTNEIRLASDPNFIGLTIDIPTFVGEELQFNNSLGAVSYGILGIDPISLSSFTNTNNTALFYLSSQTDNVSWLSESGASYLVPATVTATPIPATAWLFCSGILGLFGLRRKSLT